VSLVLRHLSDTGLMSLVCHEFYVTSLTWVFCDWSNTCLMSLLPHLSGHLLHRFGDIAGFCAPNPTLFHPNFLGVFPLDQVAHVVVIVSRYSKLIGHEILFRSISSYVITVPERHRLTDRRTDR